MYYKYALVSSTSYFLTPKFVTPPVNFFVFQSTRRETGSHICPYKIQELDKNNSGKPDNLTSIQNEVKVQGFTFRGAVWTPTSAEFQKLKSKIYTQDCNLFLNKCPKAILGVVRI